MPKATIALLDGRAVGIGPEFLTSCDMAFASDRSMMMQFEVAMGVLPGATGSQRLPHLLGRMRALEVILGCDEIPAEVAERYGLINRVLPQPELKPFVARLARRIATFPAEAIALKRPRSTRRIIYRSISACSRKRMRSTRHWLAAKLSVG